jgi:hypothetical protein
MKKLVLAVALCLVVPFPALAQRKACDELKGEIEGKIKANGVADFTLDAVAADQVKDEKVVGSCDGGTKKIVYKRGGGGGAPKADAAAKADAPAKKSEAAKKSDAPKKEEATKK